MDDLISRQAAIDEIKEIYEWHDNVTKERIIEHFVRLPSAQPERMKGKWKRAYLDHKAMGKRPSVLYCSICNQCIAYSTNFCPNCGARMTEEDV